MLVLLLVVTLGGGSHRASLYRDPPPGVPLSGLHLGHHLTAQALARKRLPPALAPPLLEFDQPRAQLPARADVASIAIPGRGGLYLVPYIQTQPDLHFRLHAENLPPDSAIEVTLDGGEAARTMEVGPPGFEGTFQEIGRGDHTLSAVVQADSQDLSETRAAARITPVVRLTHVARGDIVSAIGDSTTEGNGGPVFHFIPNWVTALSSAAEWTSPDGRNFPQAGGVAHPSAPASFTSTLGTLLEQARGYPVLVLNDGWSGATAEAYTHITSSAMLAEEYAAVRPNSWIVNLGVNDPLAHQTPEQFDMSLHIIVRDLNERYGARNGDIHVACPTYARDSRHDGETGYLPVIDRLRGTTGLGAAPNFFAYYRDVPGALADSVHPNASGYRDMAALWAQALAGSGRNCT